MSYQSTLSYLMEQLPMYQRIGKTAYKAGLDNTIKLDNYFNRPHKAFSTIHIAGTNGKGSVSHMLASVLQDAGYTTGLYTSPHLVDFRERIKINGKQISKNFITGFIKQHKPFFDSFSPSFFELSQYIAFEWFLHNKVDIAVIETGLGGRLDATNIIEPVVSVITNIGLDHTDILGDSLEKIAAEKAGIIKPETPVIIGEYQRATMPVFEAAAREKNANLLVADQLFNIDYSLLSTDNYHVFNVKMNGELHLPGLKNELLGLYQKKNTITALAAIAELIKSGFNLNRNNIYNGIKNVIKNTGLSGRWQTMAYNPKVICDTAHNADGLISVFRQVAETPHTKLHLIIGFVADKDITTIMQYLPAGAIYYFTRLSVPRTLDERELTTIAQQYGITGRSFTNVKDAYLAAKANAGPDDLILITGSTFLVGDFLASVMQGYDFN